MQNGQDILRSVIDNLDSFLLVLQTDGTVSAVNIFAENLLGEGNYVGQSVWDLPIWCNAGVTEKTWKQACLVAVQGTRVTFVDEIDFVSQKKSKLHFSLSPIKNDAGQLVSLLAEGRPFTSVAAVINQQTLATNNFSGFPAAANPAFIEKPQNAIAQRASSAAGQKSSEWLESDDRFRLMIENIEDYAMFMVDLEGFITSWNRGAERLTGYSDVEAIGRHFSMLYPQEALDKDHATHELMMAQLHGRYEEEGLRVRKNGTHYYAQIIVWRINDHEGKTVGYAKITRDVTALKQAQDRESQLFESENRFRLMVESIDDYAMFMVDPKGFITSWNRGAERLTGYSESEALGRPFSILYPKNELPVEHALYELAMARQNGRHEEEGMRVRKDGSAYHAQVIVWPVEDKSGEIVSFAKITRDITARRAAEQALRDSEAHLHESARRKDEYLAMLAHELRNPLAPIRNSTALLRRLSKAEDGVNAGLEVIDRQVAHMTRLIDDLLDVARISRGKIELRRETFELGELIRQSANDFNTGYQNKRVELQVELPAHPVWLLADPTRIAQVIGNLLHNALKFTEPHGHVRISLAEEVQGEKSFGLIRVTDTGIGIDPRLLDQLFEPFVQGNQDLARSKGGLGLGLALIKGFATLHGGSVQAKSAGLGHGAEFLFRIPLVKGVVPNRQTDPASPSATRLRIVLVDDNRDMVETLAALLSMDGHSVHCAYDGESGLELIKAVKPDLVFCDIGLPGELDGYAVARQVRTTPDVNKTFMVALSGYGQEKDKKLAFECGFDDHLLKPIDFSSLSLMISSAEQSATQKLQIVD